MESERSAAPKGLGGAAAWCSARGGLCFGIIVVLSLLLVFTYAYYNGWFGLGGGKRSGKKKKGGGDTTDDPETEQLIDSLNHSQGFQ